MVLPITLSSGRRSLDFLKDTFSQDTSETSEPTRSTQIAGQQQLSTGQTLIQVNPVDQFNTDTKKILTDAQASQSKPGPQSGESTPTAQPEVQQTAAPIQTNLVLGQTSSSGASVDPNGNIRLANGQTIDRKDPNFQIFADQEGFEAEDLLASGADANASSSGAGVTTTPTGDGQVITPEAEQSEVNKLIQRRNSLINQRFNTLAEQEIQAGLTNVEDLQRQTSELIIKGSDAIADITPEELRRLSPAQQSQLRQIDRKGIEAQLAGVRTGLQFLGQEKANEAAVKARAEAIAAEREKGININGQLVNPYTGEVMYAGKADAAGGGTASMQEYQFAVSQGYGGTFAEYKGIKDSTIAGKVSPEELQEAKDQIVKIDDLISHDGLNSSVGPTFLQRIAFGDIGGAKDSFIGGVEQLVSDLSLESLIAAKARGAAFGQLSDTEMRILASAATKIGSWTNKDKAGNVTGFDVDQKSFLKELDTIKAYTQRAIDKAEASSAGSGSPGQPFDEPVDAQGLFSNDLNTSQKGSVAEVSIRKSPVSKRTGDDIECVIYSRMLAPGLPTMGYKLKVGPNNAPLSDADKLRKSQNAQMKRRVIVPGQEAVTNAVAIMPDVGFYGHTANVVTVNENGTITIQEANYRDNMITQRTGTPEALKIEGYWVP